MSATRRPRVLLADDHEVVRDGLKALLRKAGFDVVGEASDGREAIAMCDAVNPEVAVLDIAMPLLNGIDAARSILKDHPATKIVLLTMYTEDSYVIAGLRAGIKGYVLKSNATSSLVQAIRAVSRDDMYLGVGVSQAVVNACLANPAGAADPLSSRERAVLQLIAEGKTMKDVGALLGISPRTAETHRARIMHRLNIHDIPGLVRYALDRGIVASTPSRAGADERIPAALRVRLSRLSADGGVQ